MISQSRFVPLLGDVTVYLFDEAQQLTSEAQNALLKISEEPPKHLYIIFCATEPEKIIETLKSRCTTFQVNLLPIPMIRDLLDWVCKEEGENPTG